MVIVQEKFLSICLMRDSVFFFFLTSQDWLISNLRNRTDVLFINPTVVTVVELRVNENVGIN